MTSWGTWDTPQAMAAPCPDPDFLSHHVGRSRVSQRVALTWVYTLGAPDPGFYRETTDGGETWLPPEELPWPPAFGPDTSPSFHISGLYPHYDRQDRFHIVCAVMPFVGGTGYAAPVEIWHWCRENEPQWSRIVRAECDTLRAGMGYNALFACRPSIGEDRLGGLHVCWEQFDSLNIEPGPPEYLRADIWYCRDNDDNGATWQDPARVTVPDQTSKRFPCIYDYTDEDTMRVVYMLDVVAGFFVQGEGHPTRNPVICQHIPIEVGGVEEKDEGGGMRAEPGLPSVLRGPELIGYDCRVLDIAGRDVTDRRERLAPGVYFLHSPSGIGHASLVTKVIVQR
jgi:hypothetical protein